MKGRGGESSAGADGFVLAVFLWDGAIVAAMAKVELADGFVREDRWSRRS